MEAMSTYANEKLYPEEWDYEGLIKYLEGYFLDPGEVDVESLEDMSREDLQDMLIRIAHEKFEAKEALIGEEMMRELEKAIMLKVVDAKWMEHLDDMDMLREGITLRAYGQKNPLVEYKFEAYEMFQGMIEAIKHETVLFIYRVRVEFAPAEGEAVEAPVQA